MSRAIYTVGCGEASRQYYIIDGKQVPVFPEPVVKTKEPWQEIAKCPWTTSGICIANGVAACKCNKGEYPYGQ